MTFKEHMNEIFLHIQQHCTMKNIFHTHLAVLGLVWLKMMFAKVLFSLGFFLPLLSFAGMPAIEAVEQEHGVADTTMYTMIYMRELDNAFEKTCDAASLNTGKERFTLIEKKLDKKYRWLSQAEVLDHSWLLYERLQDMHDKKANILDDEQYCTVKYIMYHTQQYLREKHLAILKDTEIVNDFGTLDNSNLYGWTTKRDFLDMKLKMLVPYKKKLGVSFSFDEENQEFRSSLDVSRQELLDRSKLMMQLTIYKVLYNLKQAKLFTTEDINILKDKVVFEYVDSCEMINGRYDIKETLKSSGEHVKYETEALYLKVNVCGNFFIIRDLDKTYEKIVTHELGHHFYYYHDRTGHDDFKNICWSNEQEQNGQCSADDFVSDYAQTASVEDYAEHFMHWFLDIVPHTSKKIREKTTHFDRKL